MKVDVEGLPRRNGELAFDAPWQSRVFGLAAGVVSTSYGGDWTEFRERLKAAVAEHPGRPYWESWTAALEELLGELLPVDLLHERLGDTDDPHSRDAPAR